MNYINAFEFEELTQSDTPVLVQFSAPWCVYCRRILPAMEKITKQYADKLSVVAVNIDDEPRLANKEQIEIVPTLVIYQKGSARGSIVAPESKARIDLFIKETVGI